ncbi:MAG: efflux RND transporter periplasmic adaptor subunit [Candidatus Zixiibacteriota bacterium]
MKVRIGLALLLLSFLAACSSDNGLPGGSGMIEATEVMVSAEASGRIEELYAEKGMDIEIDQALALIDTTTPALQLAQAEAVLESAQVKLSADGLAISRAELTVSLAEKEYKRIQTLLKSGSANQQQFDNVDNALRQAELGLSTARTARTATQAEISRINAEIALLKKRLQDCRPVSPLTGTVIDTYVEVGELVAPGKAMVRIARLDTVEVDIYVPPNDLTEIHIGDKADVDPEDGREAPLSGRVVWISPKAEFTPKNVQTKEARADLVYAVKVRIPNPNNDLKIGMPVLVTIP